MKVAVCSDLHLEFGSISLKNPGGVEVLILSGDILVERDLDPVDSPRVKGINRDKSQRIHTFFDEVCAEFPHVIYVAGNHEHYSGDFKFTLSELKRKLGHHKNLHILDKEVFKLGDVNFVGSTLWTDMNKQDPMTLQYIRNAMNDFRIIKNSNRKVCYRVPLYEYDASNQIVRDASGKPKQISTEVKEETATFSPEDAVEENKKCFDFIKQVVVECPPWESVVVVGHHTPSSQSCHPRYKHDHQMNGGYHNNYEEFILDNRCIKLWTHGHTHERFDYMIGTTRVVCNPRGYDGYESIADNFELKVVEL